MCKQYGIASSEEEAASLSKSSAANFVDGVSPLCLHCSIFHAMHNNSKAMFRRSLRRSHFRCDVANITLLSGLQMGVRGPEESAQQQQQ